MIKRMLAVAAMLTLALSCAVMAYAGNGIQENNFDNGYQCSGWALDEVRQADFLGIFPESLRTADLTKPITRAEFAGVSVNTYIRMAKRAVEPASPNPFTDTDDTDVLRAYAAQIVSGTGNRTFSPDANLTREQALAIAVRMLDNLTFAQ